MAADESRLPLRTAGAGARRIRVLRSAAAIRGTHVAVGVQPHRGRAVAPDPARRPVLASPFAPAGAVRRERAHRGGAGLLGVGGDRSAAGVDRGRGTGLARAPGGAASGPVAAQGRRRPPSDRRCRGCRLRRRPPTRLRRTESSARWQTTRVAHLSVPAPPLLAQVVRTRRIPRQRCLGVRNPWQCQGSRVR